MGMITPSYLVYSFYLRTVSLRISIFKTSPSGAQIEKEFFLLYAQKKTRPAFKLGEAKRIGYLNDEQMTWSLYSKCSTIENLKELSSLDSRDPNDEEKEESKKESRRKITEETKKRGNAFALPPPPGPLKIVIAIAPSSCAREVRMDLASSVPRAITFSDDRVAEVMDFLCKVRRIGCEIEIHLCVPLRISERMMGHLQFFLSDSEESKETRDLDTSMDFLDDSQLEGPRCNEM